MKIQIVITSFSLLMIFSCKKQQPQISIQNACDCETMTSADFYIEELSTLIPSIRFDTETDTSFFDKTIQFRIKDNEGDIKWYLGSEILSGPKIERIFDNTLAGLTIPVTAVVRKKSNKLCFPDDSGYDSVVKYFVISYHNIRDSSFLLEGIFRVKDANKADSVDIRINFRHNSIWDLIIDIYNYDGNGTNQFNIVGNNGSNYREMRFNLEAHKVKVKHLLSGIVKIEIIGNASQFPTYLYTGRQL